MTTMEPRISLVTLGVADLDRARNFYRAMGWEPAFDQDGVMFFQVGGTVFALWGREQLAEDCALPDNGGFGGMALAYNVREQDEVDEIMAMAAAAGATIRKPAAETFWGGYSGVFTDPDGHPWEIAHNPFWTINDDGGVQVPPQ